MFARHVGMQNALMCWRISLCLRLRWMGEHLSRMPVCRWCKQALTFLAFWKLMKFFYVGTFWNFRLLLIK